MFAWLDRFLTGFVKPPARQKRDDRSGSSADAPAIWPSDSSSEGGRDSDSSFKGFDGGESGGAGASGEYSGDDGGGDSGGDSGGGDGGGGGD